jgi:hypothetical protein
MDPIPDPLRRVLRKSEDPKILDILSEKLSGADLTSLMLEAMRRRAQRVSPSRSPE